MNLGQLPAGTFTCRSAISVLVDNWSNSRRLSTSAVQLQAVVSCLFDIPDLHSSSKHVKDQKRYPDAPACSFSGPVSSVMASTLFRFLEEVLGSVLDFFSASICRASTTLAHVCKEALLAPSMHVLLGVSKEEH